MTDIDHLYPRTSTYLGPQIKRIRLQLGLSILEFSRFCSLSFTTIHRIEKGLDLRSPSTMTWNKINRFLTKVKYFERQAQLPKITMDEIEDCVRIKPIAIPHPGIQTRWVSLPTNHINYQPAH